MPKPHATQGLQFGTRLATPLLPPWGMGMVYYVVQPWGRGDKHCNATIMSEHSTPEDAYHAMDVLVEVMSPSGGPGDSFEAYVVDEQRPPVPRPA